MRTSIIATNRELGLTLIELAVVMIVISILAAVYAPNLRLNVSDSRIQATINELDIIANAAQNYASLNQSTIDTTGVASYTFPDESNNNCTNAIAVMTRSAFLIGVGTASIWFDEPYSTSCTPQTFSIGITTDSAQAQRIKNTLGSVAVSGEHATYTVNKPTLLPIINDYIALLDENTWDAQSKTIANVADVSYTFGKKASQAVYDAGLVCAHGNCGLPDKGLDYRIEKPRCPENATPTFIITGVRNPDEDITRAYYGSQDIGDGHWYLSFKINEGEKPAKTTLWSYITKCE